MTPYLLMMQACGLSQREAAELRGVRLDTVKSWCSGRNAAPIAAIDQLKDLYRLMVERSGMAVEALVNAPEAAELVLGYPADDHEARVLGLPCVGAWRAYAAMVLAELDRPVQMAPRGSTPETAVAIQAHDL